MKGIHWGTLLVGAVLGWLFGGMASNLFGGLLQKPAAGQ